MVEEEDNNEQDMFVAVNGGDGRWYRRGDVGPYLMYPCHIHDFEGEEGYGIGIVYGGRDVSFRWFCNDILYSYDSNDVESYDLATHQLATQEYFTKGLDAVVRRVRETGVSEVVDIRVEFRGQALPERHFYVWVSR